MSLALRFAAMPIWATTLIFVVVPTLIAMAGPSLVRRTVGLERLAANNEVAGFKFAVLGVVYAVLLGFAVIVAWERLHDAETAVANEAGAIATLYRLSEGLPAPNGGILRHRLGTYIAVAIGDDWPAMSRGGYSPTATRAVNDLYAAVLAERPTDAMSGSVDSGMLSQLNELTQARRQRIVLAEGVVPGVLWAVLGVGALVTVGFTFFFGTPNLRAQGLMTGLLAVTIFMGLLVIVSINGPFTGDVSVSSAPLHEVLAEFGR